MYPYNVISNYNLYDIFTVIGIIFALIMLKIMSSKCDISNKVYNYYVVIIAISILLGFAFSALFQSLFTYIETGKADLFNDGITFYGGLFGGIITFLVINAIFGRLFFKDNEHYKELKYILEIAPSSITIAHAFGRIGCLFNGCCHGNFSEKFGVNMWVDEINAFSKCVPLQLYEAIFLFVLFAVLTVLFFKKIHIEMELYCISYGVWRFIIEFFRSDDRGALIVGVLTPSQGFAIIFILAGLALIIYKKCAKKHITSN